MRDFISEWYGLDEPESEEEWDEWQEEELVDLTIPDSKEIVEEPGEDEVTIG